MQQEVAAHLGGFYCYMKEKNIVTGWCSHLIQEEQQSTADCAEWDQDELEWEVTGQ